MIHAACPTVGVPTTGIALPPTVLPAPSATVGVPVRPLATVAVAALPPMLRLATGVVLATVNGAVPVAAVLLTVKAVAAPFVAT